MTPFNSPYGLLALYGSAALWNFSMGLFQVLMPLYALSLGFSVLKIGTIIALPVLLEMVLRLAGGTLSDRFGEGRILQICYLLIGLSGAALLGAESYGGLLIAQTLSNSSRSVFWITVQSLASQIPGAPMGKKLGALTAVNYGGSLVGFGAGGLLAAGLGYRSSFIVIAACGALCVVMGSLVPQIKPKPRGRTIKQIAVGMASFLRYAHAWLTVCVSYAAALPVSMTLSIYPLYLAQLGYSEKWIGMVISLRPLGAVLVGLALGVLISLKRQQSIYALGMASLGIFLIASGLTGNILALGLFILIVGAAGTVMDLLYQVRAAALSKESDRSAAMASMGLGWILSPLLTPVVLGWLAQTQGFPVAFLAAGLFFLALSLGARWWRELLGPTELPLEATVVGTLRKSAQR